MNPEHATRIALLHLLNEPAQPLSLQERVDILKGTVGAVLKSFGKLSKAIQTTDGPKRAVQLDQYPQDRVLEDKRPRGFKVYDSFEVFVTETGDLYEGLRSDGVYRPVTFEDAADSDWWDVNELLVTADELLRQANR